MASIRRSTAKGIGLLHCTIAESAIERGRTMSASPDGAIFGGRGLSGGEIIYGETRSSTGDEGIYGRKGHLREMRASTGDEGIYGRRGHLRQMRASTADEGIYGSCSGSLDTRRQVIEPPCGPPPRSAGCRRTESRPEGTPTLNMTGRQEAALALLATHATRLAPPAIGRMLGSKPSRGGVD